MESNQNASGNMADESLDEKNVPDVSFEGVKLSMESGNLMDENRPQSSPPVSPGGTVHPKTGTGFYFAAQVKYLFKTCILGSEPGNGAECVCVCVFVGGGGGGGVTRHMTGYSPLFKY